MKPERHSSFSPFGAVVCGLVLQLGCLLAAVTAASASSLQNAGWQVSLTGKGTVLLRRGDLAALRFEPRFMVFSAANDPQFDLRFGELGERQMRDKYNVATWVVKPASPAAKSAAGVKSSEHVADGFDLQVDRAAGSERTFDAFAAAPSLMVVATKGVVEAGRVVWEFAPNPRFELRARLELPADGSAPLLHFAFTPKAKGWFSVAYVGAPAVTPAAMDEMWQPLIWQEKRFPNRPYLTESGRCTIPGTLVTRGGVTWGVLADPEELPFQPMPKLANSRFGVAVRNAAGEAQPTLFAPILGGSGSKMKAGETFVFHCRLHVSKGGTLAAYEQIARGLFGFRDYRQNDGMGSLNRTLDRTVDYAMSKWARFDEDLRGSAYETDVPGSVKNVSALHALGAALVLDDRQYFDHRARPMLEYVLSREKFLFTTDPKVKGQGASPNMTGPCAPVSELTALYEMSGRRSPVLLKLAQDLFGQTRTLNLDDPVRGDIWQNALALYRATGDAKWLARAKAGADAYVNRRMATTQSDFSDNGSRGMFFWTSYAPNWMELYELFEATGERRYLDAAREGARRFAQFIWMCPQIPPGEVLVNEGGQAPIYRKGVKFPPIKLPEENVPAWRVSEIGLTCESSGTSKGHRGILLTSFAPRMLRLAQQTGDEFLHDIARAAVVGRYTSFPGYHMNTARTTVYEKPDFAERPTAEINSTSSLHYNHIWPQIAMLLDYLVSDAAARSAGAIDFPSHFAEGYAYIQSKVYGDQPGKFYGDTNVWLWMPKGLLTFDNSEINYIAARGGNTLYLVLMNQSDAPLTANLALDGQLVPVKGKTFTARKWSGNKPAGNVPVESGRFAVDIAAKGITALAIDGLKVTPRFQQKLQSPAQPWKTDFAKHASGDTRAMVLNFGGELQWAYVYLQARETLKQATLRYSSGGEWKTATDAAFPFEFSVPLSADAKEFAFEIEGVAPSGEKTKPEAGRLAR